MAATSHAAARTNGGSRPRKTSAEVTPLSGDRGAAPHDLDAEAAVLSAVLLGIGTDALELEPQHFYADAHRRIYEGVLDLHCAHQPVDLVTVAAWLRDRERIAQVGGMEYLAQLSDATPAVANVSAHAEIVRGLAERRLQISRALALAAAGRAHDFAEVDRLRAELGAGAKGEAQGKRTPPLTATAVLEQWRSEGPLRHEPTGIARLDELTGGGPVYGSRWYLAGAPDAGKTALLVQLAHVYAERGVSVGLLAADEDAGDLVTRLAQRRGWARHHCEARDASVLADVDAALRDLPIRIYDPTWTIEAAAEDLAAHAPGGRAMFGVDSIQTVQCDAELAAGLGREMATAEAVAARTRALRAVATRHRLLALATSEMARGAYARGDDRTATLAAAKWSGSIEYSARVMLGLRSVAGEKDMVEIELAKNKHGPKDEMVYVRMDRRAQTLTAVDFCRGLEDAGGRQERQQNVVRADAAQVALVLARRPGLATRELPAAVRAATGSMSRDRVMAGLHRLADAVVVVSGPRSARYLHLDGRKVAPEVLELATVAERALVAEARPPQEQL